MTTHGKNCHKKDRKRAKRKTRYLAQLKYVDSPEGRVYHKNAINVRFMKEHQRKNAEIAAPYRKGKYKGKVTYID